MTSYIPFNNPISQWLYLETALCKSDPFYVVITDAESPSRFTFQRVRFQALLDLLDRLCGRIVFYYIGNFGNCQFSLETYT